jgi:hypothetical protein
MKILLVILGILLFATECFGVWCEPGYIQRTAEEPCKPERCALMRCRTVAQGNSGVVCSPEAAMLIECTESQRPVAELMYCAELRDLFNKALDLELFDACYLILSKSKQCDDWYIEGLNDLQERERHGF